MNGRNVFIPMTRRYPDLKEKQKVRDSKVAKMLIRAWDDEQDKDKVFSIWVKEHSQLSDPRYWELLKTVWIITGSVALSRTFRSFMRAPRGYKSYFMTPEEKTVFDKLPDSFIIYRAHNVGEMGLSYTLSEAYAKDYQRMYNKEIIETKIVNKKDCFAYIERNAEAEILVL